MTQKKQTVALDRDLYIRLVSLATELHQPVTVVVEQLINEAPWDRVRQHFTNEPSNDHIISVLGTRDTDDTPPKEFIRCTCGLPGRRRAPGDLRLGADKGVHMLLVRAKEAGTTIDPDWAHDRWNTVEEYAESIAAGDENWTCGCCSETFCAADLVDYEHGNWDAQ